MWLPDVRMESPDLIKKKRKPTGNVKINRAHPLGRDLVYIHDVGIHDNMITSDTTTKKGVSITGRANVCTDGSNDAVIFNTSDSFARLQTFTASILVTLPEHTADTCNLFNQDDRMIITFNRFGSSRGFMAFFYNGSVFVFLNSGVLPSNSNFVRVTAKKSEGAGLSLHVHEVNNHTFLSSGDTNDVVYDASRGASLGARTYPAPVALGQEVIIHGFHYYSRELTEREICNLDADPYQMLVPA